MFQVISMYTHQVVATNKIPSVIVLVVRISLTSQIIHLLDILKVTLFVRHLFYSVLQVVTYTKC